MFFINYVQILNIEFSKTSFMFMRMRMHMEIPKSSRKWFKSSNIDPKWGQNGVKMEPKWSQNGAKVLLWSFLACIWESIYFLMPKWNQSGTKVDPKWSPNMRKCNQTTSTKTWSFPDTIFDGFSMILGLFLDQLFNIFLFFFNNSKKGLHAFRLRHGEWIEGLTYQFWANIAPKSNWNRPRKKQHEKHATNVIFHQFLELFWDQKCLKIDLKTLGNREGSE